MRSMRFQEMWLRPTPRPTRRPTLPPGWDPTEAPKFAGEAVSRNGIQRCFRLEFFPESGRPTGRPADWPTRRPTLPPGWEGPYGGVKICWRSCFPVMEYNNLFALSFSGIQPADRPTGRPADTSANSPSWVGPYGSQKTCKLQLKFDCHRY